MPSYNLRAFKSVKAKAKPESKETDQTLCTTIINDVYIVFFPWKGNSIGVYLSEICKSAKSNRNFENCFCFHFFLQFTSCVLHYSLKCIVHLCYCSIKIFEVFLLHHNTIMVYVYGLRLRLVVHYISVRALHIRCLFRNSNAHMFFSGSRSS